MQKKDAEIIPSASVLKRLNDTMMEVFMRLKRDEAYGLMPAFNNSILKQLEFQAKVRGEITDQPMNVYNINMIKQEVVRNVDRLMDSEAIDISKLNSEEFINEEVRQN